MKPLVVLVAAFVLALSAMALFTPGVDYSLAGRIAMSVMLLFTAMAHFAFRSGMELMLPTFVRWKGAVVFGTGIIEIMAAVGLLVPGMVWITAWLLILFFLLILPANIYAAVHKIDYQKANQNGPGLKYLWFRVPLQLFFIGWVYAFALY